MREMTRRVQAALASTGGVSSPFNYFSFFAPLQTSLILSRGVGDPTFTRASVATVVDFEGLIKPVLSGEARFTGARRVANVLTATEDFTDINGGFDLNNTNTVNSVTFTNANAYRYKRAVGSTPIGTLWVATAVLSSSDKAQVGLSGAQPNGLAGDYKTAVALTSTPTRYQVVVLQTVAGLMQVGLDNRITVGGDGTSSGTVTVTDFQLEQVTGQSNQNPSEYVSVGVLSAPYHGAGVDGVQYFTTENGNTVASNVVTEATGAAIADATLKGYLAEGSRQNRCLYSNVLENAAWTASNVTVDDDSAVAPDGTTTAATLTATAGNGTVIQDLGVVGSAAKAGGFYIKRKTGTGNIDLTLDNGSTWTTKTVTAAWTRIEITQTLTNEDFGIRIVTSGDAVYVWNGQVETASFLSSTVTTTSAAVTRAADVLTYPTSGNVSGTAGTFYCESSGKGIGDAVLTYLLFSSDGTASSFSKTGGGGNTPYIYDGAGFRGPGPTITSPSSTNKLACSWGGVTCLISANGTNSASLTFDGDFNFGAAIYIGSIVAGANNVFGNIRNVRIAQQALSSVLLQTITA